MQKKSILFILLFVSGIVKGYSCESGVINSEKLIHQFIIGKSISGGNFRLTESKGVVCNNFFTSNIDLVQHDLPDSVARTFVSEVFLDIQTKNGNEDSKSFVQYTFQNVDGKKDGFSLTISKCGFSKSGSYAMVYYELVTDGLGGTGAFVTFYLKDLWFLMSETRIWAG